MSKYIKIAGAIALLILLHGEEKTRAKRQRRKLMKYRVCEHCRAHNDHGERCECRTAIKRSGSPEGKPLQTESEQSDINHFDARTVYHTSTPIVNTQNPKGA